MGLVKGCSDFVRKARQKEKEKDRITFCIVILSGGKTKIIWQKGRSESQ